MPSKALFTRVVYRTSEQSVHSSGDITVPVNAYVPQDNTHELINDIVGAPSNNGLHVHDNGNGKRS